MNMKQKKNGASAFTLLELLTVIAIIGVLAGLLFPAIKSALLKAEIARADQGVNGLATALQSYYTQYGRWPIVYPAGPLLQYEDFIVDANLMALLSGTDVGSPPATVPYAVYDSDQKGNYQNSAATIDRNTRQSPFLQVKKTDLASAGTYANCYVDPWGRPYHFRLDVNYQNWINNPFSSTASDTVTNQVLVWSLGPDGQYDNKSGDGNGVNKDNRASWH